MNILMALIILLLVVIVVWMGTMTVLYTIQNEAVTDLTKSVRQYVDIVNKIADRLAETERFNLSTIQQARRIVNEVDKRMSKPEPFKYVEKEEDEDNPRS